MEYKTLNSIKYIEMNPEKPNPEDALIVLFHGYGANAKNLAPLRDFIDKDKKWKWIFPEGPLKISLGGNFFGQAWFPINVETADQSDFKSLELKKITLTILDFLNHFKFKKLILGGFSQGSILSLNVSFQKKIKPDALLLYSGVIMNQDKWSELSTNCKGVPFLQSHGKQDSILKYEMGQNLYSFLIESGLKGQFVSFDGEHEIPLEVLNQSSQFLNHL